MPPLRHGCESHSFTSYWQWEPVKPERHVQEYPLILSVHVPPLKQELRAR